MGTGPHKAEDVLKVMEALGSAVMKERVKDKVGPFGLTESKGERLMPTYPVKNLKTGETKELSMTMTEYGQWKETILTGIETGGAQQRLYLESETIRTSFRRFQRPST